MLSFYFVGSDFSILTYSNNLPSDTVSFTQYDNEWQWESTSVKSTYISVPVLSLDINVDILNEERY